MSGAVSLDEIALLERCALNAWPALDSRAAMGWVLRSANGYTKRANSANALAPTGDVETLRREVEVHYAALGQRAIVRLSPLAPAEADPLLEAAGYALVEPSLVLTAPLDRAAPDPAVTILPHADRAWLTDFAQAAGEAPETIERHGQLLGAIALPRGFASVLHGGRIVAFGLAVVEHRRAGLFDIAVHPSRRGRGLGRAVSAALLAWGRSAGAQSAYLQVTQANAPALRVYAGLGFAEAYRYHYRVAPTPGPAAAQVA